MRLRCAEPAPRFVADGLHVILDPLQMQTVPRDPLGLAVASLAADDRRARIIAVVDVVLSTNAG